VFILVAAGPALAGSLQLSYSTYLGGDETDRGYGIAVDGSGNAYVTGYTGSTDFPTGQAFQGNVGSVDAFVSKLAPSGGTLVYSTYLGGGGIDRGYGIAVDGSGNAYVTGYTGSTDFPTAQAFQGTYAGGSWDAFVSKVAPSGGTLVYSTYLGGGSGDSASGIALDTSGAAYVTGYTWSTNFPTGQAFQGALGGGGNYDAFVSKLAPGGTALTYSTYLGGAGYETGNGIAVDGSGNAYVTGYTTSTDFPTAQAFQGTRPGDYDAFVSKLAPSGATLTYSTYLGGGSIDYGRGIAVDNSGNAYVTGETFSTDFPTAQAFQGTNVGASWDAFVSKLAPSGAALAYSTYLGGGAGDFGFGIAVDNPGNAYVTGQTGSADFPTGQALQGTNAGSSDAFVSKLAPTGATLTYSTYLGGFFNDFGYGIAVDTSGNAYVTGFTGSYDFPTAQAFQGTNAGGDYDAFVFKIGMPSVGDELAVSFSGGGLWLYDHSGPTWAGIGGHADALENFQGDLAVDFGASGLWLYDGSWSGIGGNPQAMETCGTALYVDFGGAGLWRYDGSWSGIGGNPDDMQCCGGALYVDYGANGLWRYNGAWSGLAGDPTGMWCVNGVFYVNLSG
ncbi:MAG: hypothetical protein GY836_17945, partial [Herbaspirillum sp.]|uniref:SBBP repeat-containing protein n=1 Tax=Herbaspirillum sp. TaxID=1890675 RepID=UPI00258D9084